MFSLFVWKCRQALKLTLGQPEFFLGISLQLRIKHFQAIIHMIQNCHSGKQKTRWEKTNKGNYHWGSLGPGSASGGKRRKKLAWAKTKIGEQSEPRGSLLRGKGWLSPSPGNRSARFARRYFSYLTPFFAFPPPSDPGPTLPFSQRKYAFAFQHIGFVPRECAKGLFSFLIWL